MNTYSRQPNHTRADMALRGVYEISKVLAVPGRLEDTLANVLTLLSSFLDMRHGLVTLVDEEGTPVNVVGIGWSEERAGAWFGRIPERAVGRIFQTGMPVVVKNMENSSLFPDWSFDGPRGAESRVSFIGVPIKDRNNVIGTLTIEQIWDESTTYHAADEDVRFLTMVANLIGQTVRLLEMVQRDRERLMEQQRLLEKGLVRDTAPKGGSAKRGNVKDIGIVGTSPALQDALQQIQRVARSHSAVLLRGESGTGKELFARATHDFSPRSKKPFIKLNCAALPESVLESELFGHEKGAFTGAVAQRKGRFELADGGTLFLDEIGDTTPAFQVKLLRVLQEGEFERVGGTQTIKVDVRLVCATNRNLEELVTKGEFRADLYYRINVVSIRLPALRDRREDIPQLAREFLRRFDEEHHTEHQLSSSAVRVLESCYFPGNVRELENCIRRTATLAHEDRIGEEDFACRNGECLSSTLWKSAVSAPFPIVQPRGGMAPPPPPAPIEPAAFAPSEGDVVRDAPVDNVKVAERDLLKALESTGWVQAKAARMLGLTPRQIGYAIRKYGIEVRKF
ncbi:nif-specific transcriptional activator NifA [Novosphingobium mangrovi (ex Huang et al. 2023)]|uniref:Nif-specific regulatory protein n=1 Tax=Novosphingobium mangrovi (ex Huang et al. 2023) TaxID=2976432 RepID=A0ABT2I651_9SPHN|nr:nif-specific transcriptional activator NifA [Novosphingobium mangrovi (ex Huang et al. 2023)]MCT2400295.1 nif-specific transcriptional activator NifA [Novosphingobium mangrovi (ex Huang et al. 2023)]